MINIINPSPSRVDDYELNNLYNRLRSNSHIDLGWCWVRTNNTQRKVKSIEKV
jgi:hypothetical protein